jgi:hypothetical protein
LWHIWEEPCAWIDISIEKRGRQRGLNCVCRKESNQKFACAVSMIRLISHALRGFFQSGVKHFHHHNHTSDSYTSKHHLPLISSHLLPSFSPTTSSHRQDVNQHHLNASLRLRQHHLDVISLPRPRRYPDGATLWHGFFYRLPLFPCLHLPRRVRSSILHHRERLLGWNLGRIASSMVRHHTHLRQRPRKSPLPRPLLTNYAEYAPPRFDP